MAKEFKVFIAGSLELESARDAVRSSLQNVSNTYDRYGYSIKSYTFENFENSFCPGGQQSNYNDFILNQADFVIFILGGEPHSKTKEEFENAIAGFEQCNKPRIYVYNNIEADSDNEGILYFKKRMNELNQYWTNFKNGQLKDVVRINFNDALFNIMHSPIEMPKYNADEFVYSGSSTFAKEAKKLDILFKEYTIKTVHELNTALQSSTKSVLLMVQSMANGDIEFKQQNKCNDDLKKALRKSQAILPMDLYKTAYGIAVDYTEKGFNWVLDKIRGDIAVGKGHYDSNELQNMHDTLIHEIVNIDEAERRLNEFSKDLSEYINSL